MPRGLRRLGPLFFASDPETILCILCIVSTLARRPKGPLL
jgi:hypothetical protein